MLDTLLTQAMPYLTDLLLKNEEVQKFPKDFVSASIRWIRSWFLKDDPVTKTVVESDSPALAKEAVLKAKLQELLKNQQFAQELQEQLAEWQQHRSRIKNVVDNAEIEADGNMHIGDKGSANDGQYDEKNVVKGGAKLKAGKDFHLGDEVSGG